MKTARNEIKSVTVQSRSPLVVSIVYKSGGMDTFSVAQLMTELTDGARAFVIGQARQAGFSLIELMIVVAILAILAAIALPAYNDYTTRAKVSELMSAASACRVSVVEYYQSQAGWPPTQIASGCGDQDTRYVASLKVGANGLITVTAKTGSGAIDPAAAGDLSLEPIVSPTGHLDWSCAGAGTTIAKKYLPANCR